MAESKSVTIVDTTIPIVEYMGQRVVTLDVIDNLHHRPPGTAKRNFTENKERFQEGKHFYLVDYSKKNEFRTFEIEIPPRGLTVITERGYSMLVKSFNDDFAWDIQEQLSDSYFDNNKPMTTAEFLVQQANLILEHDQRIKRIEQQQRDTQIAIAETKIEVMEAKSQAVEAFKAASAALQHKFGRPDHYTVMAYSKMVGSPLDLNLAKVYGAKAAQLSKQRDVPIIKVPDERFGSVGSYHEDILKEVFEQLSKDVEL